MSHRFDKDPRPLIYAVHHGLEATAVKEFIGGVS
jgi:hypothetical protein